MIANTEMSEAELSPAAFLEHFLRPDTVVVKCKLTPASWVHKDSRLVGGNHYLLIVPLYKLINSQL